MSEIDMSQRIEEIELAWSRLYESPKTPSVSIEVEDAPY